MLNNQIVFLKAKLLGIVVSFNFEGQDVPGHKSGKCLYHVIADLFVFFVFEDLAKVNISQL